MPSLSAQPAAPKEPEHSYVRFTFDWSAKGVAVPRYTILMNADGTGTYHAEATMPQSSELRSIDRPLLFSAANLKAAWSALHVMRTSEEPCVSKLKNIADTGTKTLTYRDAEGDGSCTYNHSENKGTVQLTEMFVAIEQTLEEGRALDFKHRFDRLGLDAEISNLMTSIEAGRATEIGNIAATLRSIAGDTEVIQRVRLRAAKLLEQAQAGS